ncbi:MAG: fatty acid hydroxylase [Patescibacteria group bacterium]
MHPILIFGLTFCVGICIASFFEWVLHRYVMHRPLGKFDYAFKAHAVVHHQTFKADHTYHLIQEEDKWTIPMAWWNGPVLILINTLLWAIIPITAINLIHGSWLIPLGSATAAVFGIFGAFSVYYATYEYTHWCMHLPRAPKQRLIERYQVFRMINGHHLLHHRYMTKNFNVVLPLADFCLGTLLRRSPIKFAQARGPSVPDVQPRESMRRAA